MLFVDTVGPEIFSRGITVVQHAGYETNVSHRPFEDNPKSRAYVKDSPNYFAGGFVGGTSESFLKMAGTIAEAVEDDLSHGIVARHHDESHLQRYALDHPPAKILSPSYCCPPWPHRQYYYGRWKKNHAPLILAVTKTWKEP